MPGARRNSYATPGIGQVIGNTASSWERVQPHEAPRLTLVCGFATAPRCGATTTLAELAPAIVVTTRSEIGPEDFDRAEFGRVGRPQGDLPVPAMQVRRDDLGSVPRRTGPRRGESGLADDA